MHNPGQTISTTATSPSILPPTSPSTSFPSCLPLSTSHISLFLNSIPVFSTASTFYLSKPFSFKHTVSTPSASPSTPSETSSSSLSARKKISSYPTSLASPSAVLVIHGGISPTTGSPPSFTVSRPARLSVSPSKHSSLSSVTA